MEKAVSFVGIAVGDRAGISGWDQQSGLTAPSVTWTRLTTWLSGVTYSTGNAVIDLGIVYQSLAIDNTGQQPAFLAPKSWCLALDQQYERQFLAIKKYAGTTNPRTKLILTVFLADVQSTSQQGHNLLLVAMRSGAPSWEHGSLNSRIFNPDFACDEHHRPGPKRQYMLPLYGLLPRQTNRSRGIRLLSVTKI
jgi:hypothetical protein